MVARVKALDKELDPQAILTEYEEDRAALWLSSCSTVRHLPGASTQDLQAEGELQTARAEREALYNKLQ